MGIVDTMRGLLKGSTSSNSAGEARSKGAYWCHDCGERIPGNDVEGDDPPACPDCGEEMAFERSPDSAGCAC